MWLAGLVLYLIFCSAGVSAQQELSTYVYTSEEDLEEAFRNGEIDFVQLITLQELIRFGIDSSNLYLFDEIPNLSHFLKSKKLAQPELKENQRRAFIKRATPSKQVSAIVSHLFSKRLTDSQQSRYRTSIKLNLNNSITTLLRLHREYSGSERLVYRSVRYKPHSGLLRILIAGNYSDRLGLGTLFGYRGKLFSYSKDIDSESLLHPDYGGHNGFSMKLKSKSFGSNVVLSHLRDSLYTLAVFAGSIEFLENDFRPMLLFNGSELRNRDSDESVIFYKYGVGGRYEYESGYNRSEIIMQTETSTSFAAAVTEGRHFFGTAEIKYATWIYGDDFIDLSSGSKRGNLSSTAEIEKVGFRYTNKRSGQRGVLLKTVVQPAANIFLVNSFVFAKSRNGEYNFEFLTALTRSLSSSLRLRFDFLSRSKSRIENEIITRRTRAELKFKSAKISIRTYWAYNTKTVEDDYMSLLANLRFESKELGRMNVWGNLREYNHNTHQIDYWYAYIENQNELFENLSVSTKFSHSYRRENKEPHLSTFSVGLKAQI